MAQTSSPIVPILLSGGTGSRLWPLSRETYPTQLRRLIGDQSLLRQTALWVADRSAFASPLMIANAEHRFVIAEQLRALDARRRGFRRKAGRRGGAALMRS
jgi:mannose-1-phosphate guanylyltransferase/mannose-1-phosphate guanylyltransferase/mannose-6-phosphate isomerase